MSESIFCEDGSRAIWLDGPEMRNQYVDFVQTFAVDAVDAGAVIHICADSDYALYLNGAFVDCEQYDCYPERMAYDSLPVAKYLRPGENRLCVRAWHQGEDSMQYVTGEAMLIYSLRNGGQRVVSAPEGCLCRADGSYASGAQVERVTSQLSFTFHFDARGEDSWLADGYAPGADWSRPVTRDERMARTEFHPRPVRKQILQPRADVRLAAQGRFRYDSDVKGTLGLQMQRAWLSACEQDEIFEELRGEKPEIPGRFCFPGVMKLRAGLDGAYLLLDLGEPVAGLFHIDLDAPAGMRVDVAYGEHLDDLRVRASVGGRSYAFSYTCREGRQSFTHRFRRVGGRWMQIFLHGMSRPPVLYFAGALPMDYPIGRSGEFAAQNALLERILSACDRTLRLCMHAHYEDCPWREQALYAMDARNQMRSGYYLYEDSNADFALASLRLSAERARPDGLLPICAPSAFPVSIPSFSLHWVLSLRDFALHTGRLADARELLPRAKGILGAAAGWFDGKLLTQPDRRDAWNFYEWTPGLDDPDGLRQTRAHAHQYDAPLNALFCLAADALRELTGWLGEAWAACDTVEAAIRANFWEAFCGSNGLLATYSDGGRRGGLHELTQALALLAGLALQDRADEVRAALARSCGDAAGRAAPGKLAPCTLSCLPFKYEALLKDGALAPKVFADIEAKWGHMLFSGSATCWETLLGADDFDNAGSLCHGWSAIPAYFLFAHYLGVRPTAPGYARFAVEPVRLKQSARGEVHTPAGIIRVRIEGGACEWELY